jgi:hypothetical protein
MQALFKADWTLLDSSRPQRAKLRVSVLLVDDLADTGHTLKAVIDTLKNHYARLPNCSSAVIWTKGVSAFTPDYSVDFLPTNPWIHQPFEGYDSTAPCGAAGQVEALSCTHSPRRLRPSRPGLNSRFNTACFDHVPFTDPPS